MASNASTVINKERRWIILATMYVCVLAYAVSLQCIPPNLSLIIADLHLSHAQAGALMSFFALPAILVSIPAGMLADRYGHRVIGITSLVLMIIGASFTASGNSFAVLSLGRVFTGAGSMTLFVISPQLVVQWFSGSRTATALGILNSAFPTGTVIAMNTLAYLGETLGWRISIWFSAGIAALALLLFALLYAPPPQESRKTYPSPEGFFNSIKKEGRSIWLLGSAWGLLHAALLALHTFSPDFLRASGFSITASGFVTSIVMIPAIVLNPVMGYAVDRFNHKRLIISVGVILWAALVAWIPADKNWSLMLMILAGFVWVAAPAPIFSLVAEVARPGNLGLGYGIISCFQNVGTLIGPAAAGLLRDNTGSYHASYILMAAFAAMVVVTMPFIKQPAAINKD